MKGGAGWIKKHEDQNDFSKYNNKNITIRTKDPRDNMFVVFDNGNHTGTPEKYDYTPKLFKSLEEIEPLKYFSLFSGVKKDYVKDENGNFVQDENGNIMTVETYISKHQPDIPTSWGGGGKAQRPKRSDRSAATYKSAARHVVSENPRERQIANQEKTNPIIYCNKFSNK
jgi:hypothetical protein